MPIGLGLLVCALIGQHPKQDDGLRTQAELRRLVVEVWRDDPGIMASSDFLIDQTKFYYCFGGMCKLIGVAPLTPMEVPLATQCKVESVRMRIASWQPKFRIIWETRLSQVEEIIGNELALIATHKGDEQDLFKQLEENRRQADELFFDGVRYFAKREGRQMAAWTECKVTLTASATEGVEVTIKTDPAKGSSVSYMRSGDYRLERATKKRDDDMTWRLVTINPVILNGKYFFRASWKTGERRSPFPVEAINKGEMVIEPDKTGRKE